MTQQLTDALRALADDLESGSIGPAPQTVWRAGTRRRWRRRGGVGVAVAAVVAAVALVVAPSGGLSTTPAGRDSGTGATAYPQRIGHQWHVGRFHAGDGPVAMLLERVAEKDSWDEPLGWFAVSPGGHQSHLDVGGYGMPTLSPDGRWVGYWSENPRGYLLQSTTSKREVRFADVPSPQDQMQSFWNSRGDRVYVPAGGSSGDAGVVLGLDGSEVVVTSPTASSPYGWVGDDLVALAGRKAATGTAFTLMTWRAGRGWSASGSEVTQEEYPLDQGTNQWSASISPDGRRLAIAVPQTSGERGLGLPTYLYDLPSGAQVPWSRVEVTGARTASGNATVPYAENTCPMAWQSGLPLGQFDGNRPGTSDAGLVLGRWLPSGNSEAIAITEGRLGVRCLLVAADALEGGPTWALFGTSDNLLAWWWREGLATILVSAGVWAFLRARSRRRLA